MYCPHFIFDTWCNWIWKTEGDGEWKRIGLLMNRWKCIEKINSINRLYRVSKRDALCTRMLQHNSMQGAFNAYRMVPES